MHEKKQSRASGAEPNSRSSGIGSVDLAKVYELLYQHARFFSNQGTDVFDQGISVEDVVHEVFVEFFSSANLLGWNPEVSSATERGPERGLARFLSVVLRRRMLDHIRRNYRGPVAVGDRALAERSSEDPSLQSFDALEVLKDLKAEAAGDADLQLFLEAALEIDESGKVDQQLASIMGKSPAQIVNLRKRFIRRLKSKGRFDSLLKALGPAELRAGRNSFP
jgi:DNA-directed RNA polymerase specialized sigma24 family protein